MTQNPQKEKQYNNQRIKYQICKPVTHHMILCILLGRLLSVLEVQVTQWLMSLPFQSLSSPPCYHGFEIIS